MNREILFRGKNVDSGEWAYGAFVPDVLETLNGDDLMDGFIRRFNPEKHKMETVQVERDTVGQYTGLTDKNGVKIFEGDIVRYIDPDTQEYDINEIYVVGWNEYHAHILFKCFLCGKFISYDEFTIEQAKALETIDNIHDHPELIKEAKQ